jgi:cytochrome b561
VVAAAAVILVLVFVLPIPGVDQGSLFYEPYPKLSLPAFHPALGFVILVLLLPGIIIIGARKSRPLPDGTGKYNHSGVIPSVEK